MTTRSGAPPQLPDLTASIQAIIDRAQTHYSHLGTDPRLAIILAELAEAILAEAVLRAADSHETVVLAPSDDAYSMTF